MYKSQNDKYFYIPDLKNATFEIRWWHKIIFSLLPKKIYETPDIKITSVKFRGTIYILECSFKKDFPSYHNRLFKMAEPYRTAYLTGDPFAFTGEGIPEELN